MFYDRKQNVIYFDAPQIPIDVRAEIKRLFLEKYRDLIIEVARYGIENKFNYEYNFYTFYHEYRILMDNNNFDLELYSRMSKYLDKKLTIGYRYDQQNRFKSYTIDTKEGIFKVNTNIWGMKHLLKSSVDEGRFKNQELESIPRLLDNLKVDYNELPMELRKGVNKVRSRKK